MSQKKSYYQILGVEPRATDEEIKQAFRKLALRLHPDRNPDNEEAASQFSEVSEAYAVLSDPERRARYDRDGTTDPTAPSASGLGAVTDMLGSLFKPKSGQDQRGADIQQSVRLRLEEVLVDQVRTVRIARTEICETCAGKRAAPGTKPLPCPGCEGTGAVRPQKSFFKDEKRACPQCRGSGKLIKEFCPECRGRGRRERDRTFSVKIPAGIESNARIRHPGEGHMGPADAAAGDLYILVEIEDHPAFKRHGSNLYAGVSVSFVLAALGGEVRVATLEAPRMLVIPPGTQNGSVLRMKGCGLPVRGSRAKGDLFVTLSLTTPTELSGEQAGLLARFLALEQAKGPRLPAPGAPGPASPPPPTSEAGAGEGGEAPEDPQDPDRRVFHL